MIRVSCHLIVHVSFLSLVTCLHGNIAAGEKVTIKAVFNEGSTQTQTAFKYSLEVWNSKLNGDKNVELHSVIDVISLINERPMCIHRSEEREASFAIFEEILPDHYENFNALFTHSSIPIIANLLPEENRAEMTNLFSNMRPDMHHVLIATVLYHGWKNVVYFYHSFDGLLRLESIFQDLADAGIHIDFIKSISSGTQAINLLAEMEESCRGTPKHVILDCPDALAREVISQHMKRIQLSQRNFHYLLSGLMMDDFLRSSTGGLNITGFRIVDPLRSNVKDFLRKWSLLNDKLYPEAGRHYISAHAALMYDAVSLIGEAVLKIHNVNLNFAHPESLATSKIRQNETKDANCDAYVNFTRNHQISLKGEEIANIIRKMKFEGLTGNIQFSEDGQRQNYSINVMEKTTHSAIVKIAEWRDTSGFLAIPPKYIRSPPLTRFPENHTYIITTILEEPYTMLRTPESWENVSGNDRFIGYCKDLADEIAETLGIQYEIRLVKDDSYGIEIENGEWNGMIGEVLRGEADMAISPLTITSTRERVVAFSKPFISLGISIMVFKPEKHSPGMFSFMRPLSNEIWLCVFLAYIAVTIVLFVVTRFNPNEYNAGINGRKDHPSDNTLWFAIVSLAQQNSEIAPRSLAGRIVASVWWFFVLILIASYTAIFAAVQTVNRMVTPIKSVEDLAAQTDVHYGAINSGSTYSFFRGSEVLTFKKMWDFMKYKPHLFVNSGMEGIERVRQQKGRYVFLIESPTNEYTNGRKPCNTMKVGRDLDDKGFGVATKLGSPLRDQINLAVLKLKDRGRLFQLKKKWWFEKSECPSTEDIPSEEENTDELPLRSVAGIFYVLVAGLVLSLFLAAIQYCCCSPKRKVIRSEIQETPKEEEKEEDSILTSAENNHVSVLSE